MKHHKNKKRVIIVHLLGTTPSSLDAGKSKLHDYFQVGCSLGELYYKVVSHGQTQPGSGYCDGLGIGLHSHNIWEGGTMLDGCSFPHCKWVLFK